MASFVWQPSLDSLYFGGDIVNFFRWISASGLLWLSSGWKTPSLRFGATDDWVPRGGKGKEQFSVLVPLVGQQSSNI